MGFIFYTLIEEREPKIPNTFSNQTIINITTTILRMLFILPSIGMYLLMRYRITPATIRTNSIVNIGILILFMFEFNLLYKGLHCSILMCYIIEEIVCIIHRFKNQDYLYDFDEIFFDYSLRFLSDKF